MRTAQSEAVTRLKAARLTVRATEARLLAARTQRARDELEGIRDRALRALKSAERDVAVEARAEFDRRIRQSTLSLDGEEGGAE